MLKTLLISVILLVPLVISSPILKTESSDEKIDDVVPPPRRQITFDQRQEGKYNIRADLENFVIMIIPSNPSTGMTLFDLLSKSARKRSHAKHAGKKHNKPEKKPLPEEEEEEIEAQKPVEIVEQPTVRVVQEFIEGRTPYRVDISAVETPVDSLLEIMKPPAPQPESIATILPAKGNLRSFPTPVVWFTSRKTKKLYDNLNGEEFNKNNVLLTTEPQSYTSLNSYDITKRGFTDLTDTSNSFDSLNTGNIDTLPLQPDTFLNSQSAEQQHQQQQNEEIEEGWEFKLIGAQEQCGPDRRRDSYGVCQFIPGFD